MLQTNVFTIAITISREVGDLFFVLFHTFVKFIFQLQLTYNCMSLVLDVQHSD